MIGIVITTWNTLNFLKEMVKTIRTRHPHKIIVVDNASADGVDEWMRQRVSEQPDRWCFIKQLNRGSMGHNRNVGVKLAVELGCSHIIMSQEDILLHRDCIDNLVEDHEKQGFLLMAAVAIAPHNLPEYWLKVTKSLSEYLKEDYVQWWWKKQGINFEQIVADISPVVSQELDMCLPIHGIYDSPCEGVIQCVNSDFVDKIGYYDDGYTTAEVEAVDLIHRCNLLTGWNNRKAWSSQASLFFHWGAGSLYSNNIVWKQFHEKVLEVNYQRYEKKWGGALNAETFPIPVPQPSLWDTIYTYEKLSNLDFSGVKKQIYTMNDQDFYATYDDFFSKFGFFDWTLTSFGYFKQWIHGDILEVGCAAGKTLKAIQPLCNNCVGVDVSHVALEEAKRTLPSTIQVEWADVEKHLPFPDKSFDVVLCGHTLEHLRNPGKAVEEMKRVCRDSIIIIIPIQSESKKSNLHIQFWSTLNSFEEFFGQKTEDKRLAYDETLGIFHFKIKKEGV